MRPVASVSSYTAVGQPSHGRDAINACAGRRGLIGDAGWKRRASPVVGGRGGAGGCPYRYIAARKFLGEIPSFWFVRICTFPLLLWCVSLPACAAGCEMLNAFKGLYWAWKGKAFGNQVADLLGIHRSLFHGAMEEGGCQLHLIRLYHLQRDGEPLERVALHSCTYLLPGLIKLEERFGSQALIGQAKIRVSEFYARFNQDW